MAWQPPQSPGAAPGTWVPDVLLNTTVSLDAERCTNFISPYCKLLSQFEPTGEYVFPDLISEVRMLSTT